MLCRLSYTVSQIVLCYLLFLENSLYEQTENFDVGSNLTLHAHNGIETETTDIKNPNGLVGQLKHNRYKEGVLSVMADCQQSAKDISYSEYKIHYTGDKLQSITL